MPDGTLGLQEKKEKSTRRMSCPVWGPQRGGNSQAVTDAHQKKWKINCTCGNGASRGPTAVLAMVPVEVLLKSWQRT